MSFQLHLLSTNMSGLVSHSTSHVNQFDKNLYHMKNYNGINCNKLGVI